jgi:hypothetical protein
MADITKDQQFSLAVDLSWAQPTMPMVPKKAMKQGKKAWKSYNRKFEQWETTVRVVANWIDDHTGPSFDKDLFIARAHGDDV